MTELTQEELELVSNAMACGAASAPKDLDPDPDRHGFLNSSVSADRYRFVALRIYANEEYFNTMYEAWCNWHHTDPIKFRDLESLE